MITQITYISLWEHKRNGKRCRIISKKIEGSVFSEFRIEGYNPLPCKSFKGTYTILANWLMANGWERVVDVSNPDMVRTCVTI